VSGTRVVVIGIGNPYRRDDGIGPAVIAGIERCRLPGVTLASSDGEPSQLIEAWSGALLAVLVDAVLCDRPEPGRIHRSVLHPGGAGVAAVSRRAPAGSTHGLGIPDAVRLAEALGRVPGRLVVFAVEAASIGFGLGLSPAVAACLPALTGAVLDELRTSEADRAAGRWQPAPAGTNGTA
jgi:hydrogenase maturation protease